MDPQDLLASIWETLRAATTQRTGFTLATLATVTAAGQPRARSVIVRDFVTDPERVCLATHADSDKVRRNARPSSSRPGILLCCELGAVARRRASPDR